MYVIMTFAILTACTNSEDSNGVSFSATVLENNESYLLVEPKEGSTELNSADRIKVSVNDATLLDSQDMEIKIDDIQIGMQTEIFYNGQIAESYPAQIGKCYRIKLLD